MGYPAQYSYQFIIAATWCSAGVAGGILHRNMVPEKNNLQLE